MRYSELVQYQLEKGDCLVPAEYKENYPLGLWVRNQRKQYKLAKTGKYTYITEERIRLLTDLGFEWDPFNTEWNERYSELVEFYHKNGTTIVPQKSDQNLKLARWVVKQRHQYKLLKEKGQSQMTPERIELLEKINFRWAPFDAEWMSRYKELKKHYEKHGNCLIEKENKNLSTWTDTQRRQYKLLQLNESSHMTKQRIRLLEQLNFEWTVSDAKWKARFVELGRYVRRNGLGTVPGQSETKYRGLVRWVSQQQKWHHTNRLNKERFELLNLLAFPWEPEK
eukprot:CAMPEP_0172444564 /NCGR_PEP_ID=MMETSP1065-20121228/4581_1 /TAXON_ID=265537 /ORGANISM="Amphiprora paludosa, Strain CCMP125" /LENGTH=280 /DNA_ID=CAMNT_0013195143 /DNA_START=326 /DNA_END=1168 /DNA_ORIENTATION=+